MIESAVQGLWRGLAIACVLLPFLLLVPKRERVLWAAVAVAGFLAGAALWLVPSLDVVTLTSAVLRGNTVLAGAYIVAAILLVSVHVPGDWRYASAARVLGTGLFAAVLFPLDGIEFANLVKQIAFLKESALPYVAGYGVLGLTVAAVWPALRVADRLDLRRYVAPWSLLLFAVAVRAAIEPFLIPSFEGLFARVAHDTFHLFIVLLFLPDHRYLTGWLWRLIGLAFQKSTSIVINISLFAGVTTYLIARFVFDPLPSHRGMREAQRRQAWADERARRRRAALPAAIAAVMLVGFAVRGAVFQATPTPPTRETLAVSDGRGVIDLAALADRKLHAWTYVQGDTTIRVIAMIKPDGEPTVCLDACLVCAPDGYAQLGNDLFCLFCGTPIPIDSVGDPGGCNPVPLEFENSGGSLTFDADRAVSTWKEVTRGR